MTSATINIKQPATGAAPADTTRDVADRQTARGLVFDAGGQCWSVAADCVCEVHAALHVQPVAGTAAWFLGTALARGRVLPVSDFGAWLGQAEPVQSYIEFSDGFVLGVAQVRPGVDATPVDPARLLVLPEFLDVRGSGGSPSLVPQS